MWVTVVTFTLFYAIAIWTVPGMTIEIWWKVLVAGIIASVLCVAVFDYLIRKDLKRRESSIALLNRVAEGDLGVTARQIVSATHSARMSSALRALVSNLDRTIRRF